MKGVNTNLHTCMALCRIFAKGGRGDEVAVFKKGVAARDHWNSLLILRGRDLHKGGGGRIPPIPPKYTSAQGVL